MIGEALPSTVSVGGFPAPTWRLVALRAKSD
jgi:hypothetical protein